MHGGDCQNVPFGDALGDALGDVGGLHADVACWKDGTTGLGSAIGDGGL